MSTGLHRASRSCQQLSLFKFLIPRFSFRVPPSVPSFLPSLLPSFLPFHKAAPCLGLLAGKEIGGPEVQVMLYLHTRTEYGNLNRAKHGDNAENRTQEPDILTATSVPQEGSGGAPDGWATPFVATNP